MASIQISELKRTVPVVEPAGIKTSNVIASAHMYTSKSIHYMNDHPNIDDKRARARVRHGFDSSGLTY